MTKDEIINLLTLSDTQAFRLKSMRETGKYIKEPKGFRQELALIYFKLNLADLEKLFTIKER